MMELMRLLAQLRSAELKVISARFKHIVRWASGVSGDDPRWGRLEVHDDNEKHPVWMTLGRTDNEQTYSYPIDYDLSGEDLQSFNQFGLWWHNTTKELSVDDIMDDLLDDGSRLLLYAGLEVLQRSVAPQHRPLKPHMVIDHEKGDWGVALGDQHTDQDCLILWRNSNELWIDPSFAYPQDPTGLVSYMQAHFINCYQNTERDQRRREWV